MALAGGALTGAVSAVGVCASGLGGGGGGASHLAAEPAAGRGVSLLATEPGRSIESLSMATESAAMDETTGDGEDTAVLLRLGPGCSAGCVLT